MTCSICNSSSKGAVDRMLARGISVRKVAAKHGFSASAVYRHAAGCLKREQEEKEIAARPPRRGLFGRSPLICNCQNPTLRIVFEPQPIRNPSALGREGHPFRRTLVALIESTQSHDIREEMIGVYAAKLLTLLDKELPAHVVAAIDGARLQLEQRVRAENVNKGPQSDAGEGEGGLHGVS